MADFKKALKKVLKWEGGFVDDPDDLGGRTNKGITQRTYNIYYSGDVKDITDEQVEAIYKSGFWKRSAVTASTARVLPNSFLIMQSTVV